MAVSLSSNVAALSTLLAANAAATSSAGPSESRPRSTGASNASVTPSVTSSTTPGLQVADARDHASALVDVASAAGVSISDTLVQIRRAVTAAVNPNVTAPQRDALTGGFQALLAQLHAAVSSASFGGANLLDGSSEPSGLTYSTGGAASITLHGADLRPGGPVITVSSTTDLSTSTAAQAALSEVNVSPSATQGALVRLGAQAQGLTGAGAADTSTDGAALLALQVRQQLSSIPNGLTVSTQSILNLFKG